MSTALVQHTEGGGQSISAFASDSSFETAQRMAKALASSNIVPKEYQGNIPNVLVAMELANRTGASVLQVMQSVHIIQGRPSWSSAFLIATVNASGRFTPIRYEWQGEAGKDSWGCRAVAQDKASGEVLEGSWITWGMAKAEGWVGKSGSKWKTMPEHMFKFRAAAFWTREYAPEIAMGMLTAEETSAIPVLAATEVADLNAALDAEVEDVTPPSEEEVETLRGLMDHADLGYDEAAACEALIEAGDRAAVLDKIHELQRAIVADAPVGEAQDELPL